jgi:hypothetical protein
MQRLIVILVDNLLLQQTYDTLITMDGAFSDTLSDTQHAWYMIFDLALFFFFFSFQIQEPWGPGSETGLSSMPCTHYTLPNIGYCIGTDFHKQINTDHLPIKFALLANFSKKGFNLPIEIT